MSKLKILVVDDEEAIRDMIRVALELADCDCNEAASASEAVASIFDDRPDMVLLDWMMPETSGLELLRRLKRDEATGDIPVILLTARAEEQDMVQGLDSGADDYITKPFRPRELLSRIKAVNRRVSGADNQGLLKVDGLQLDPTSQRVTLDEKPVNLGPTEYRLLKFFISHPDRAYSRAQLLDQVWGGNVYVEERTVDVHIRRLRNSLKQGGSGADYGRFIQTVRGTGYRFSASE